MYSAQAFIWLRIGASEVPMFGPVTEALAERGRLA
jgi:hypothetical protein